MAYTLKDSSRVGRIRVATGVDASGKTTFANRSISDVNATVTETDFVDVMSGYASLQSHELANVTKVDTNVYEVE